MLDGEAGQVARRRAGEGVDRLVGVADHAQVVATAEPGVEQQLLQRVDVLVFVDDEVAVLLADLRGDLRCSVITAAVSSRIVSKSTRCRSRRIRSYPS